MTPEEIQRLSYQKAVKLEKLIDEVEKRIDKASTQLSKIMLKHFLQKLTIEQGKVIAQFNQQTVLLFNKAFKIYQETTKASLVKYIVGDINTILNENDNYYRKTAPGYDIDKSDMKALLDRRLGIAKDGTLLKNGYMSGLLDDSAIRAEVQRFVFKEIFKASGFEAFKEGLRQFIEGEKGKYGAFQRYYRGFSYDAYAQLNSFTSGEYANRLGMHHFIYNGGLIETSRKFCIERNGNVYSTEEAEEWKNDKDLEAIESRESYNWLIDRGGYNCRHSIDFIAPEIAYALRPELKDE
ncbi:hypothetical protein C7S20_19435 [Christiangramia fulva]|uniref:Phage head morphogenesis domain-containing protein n=1 Tax=Christiangramia fulva TaxID=2126553 RepID=A0A2R3ZAE3_9FLAO|nr:hypothetical protein [Christiangramia fulva]AVR47249.1 hypothetical protein C7S20_19435 [Christiangramia fulva]